MGRNVKVETPPVIFVMIDESSQFLGLELYEETFPALKEKLRRLKKRPR